MNLLRGFNTAHVGDLSLNCPAIQWNIGRSSLNHGFRTIYQLIGVREKLQEHPIFHGKSGWFPVDFPMKSQTIEYNQPDGC